MTSDQTKSLREDIAYMKVLADEGMSTPLVGGPILMMFGAVFTVSSLVSWAAMRFFAMPDIWQMWISLGAFGLCAVGLPLLIRRAGRQPGRHSPANIAFGIAWQSVGIAIFILSLIVGLVCYRHESGVPATILPSVIIALYAVAWSVSAAMTRQKFLHWIAWGSYAAAIVAALVSDYRDVNLYMGIIIFLIAFVPGTVLFMREPKTTI